MNRMLASTLAAVNVLCAFLIIAAFTIGGFGAAASQGAPSLLGLAIGFIVGLLVASLICGTIAFIVLIERHLAFLVKTGEYQSELLYSQVAEPQG